MTRQILTPHTIALLIGTAIGAILFAVLSTTAFADFKGTAGSDTINAGGVVAGGPGDDHLTGSAAADDISGGSGRDTLTGGSGVDTITGGPDDDQIYGGNDRDFISGDSGNDRLDGQAGSNVIDGGIGNDTLIGGDRADSLNGGNGDDTLFGNAGDDGLTGASGRDHIYGGPGNDRIEGGLGQDLIDGGPGNDNIVSIDGAPDVVRCGSGHDVVRADGGDRVASDCETVIERPGNFGKVPDTKQQPSSDTQSIGGKASVADYPSQNQCAERPETPGRPNGARLNGSGGADTLDSTLGADCIFGGGGNDKLAGGPASDLLDGGDGINVMSGGSGDDVLLGGPLRDFIEGGTGRDTIDAGGGSNIVNGAVGNDTIQGGQFADSLNGGSDEDVIHGGAGNDGITGASGRDMLYGDAGNDRIEGGLGKDFISGGDGSDNIVAADGQVDEIRCGPGKDTVRADGEDKVDDDCERLIARVGDRYVEVPVSQRRPAIGIADQSPDTFDSSAFRALGVRRSRLIVAWNQVLTDPAPLDRWLQKARAAGVLDPLVAFNHASGERCLRGHSCPHPSRDQFEKAFVAFRQRYPWVTHISPWNEANHESQPTAHHPEWAAMYYNVARDHCDGCTLVAADVLDQKNMVSWLSDFLAHADGTPTVIGLHNYSDVNRKRSTATRTLIAELQSEAHHGRLARNFQLWLTETGGIVHFETVSGRDAWPTSTSRAADRLRYLFDLASTYRRWIRQVYVYQWRRTNADDKFDAGLVSFDGTRRAGYSVLAGRDVWIR